MSRETIQPSGETHKTVRIKVNNNFEELYERVDDKPKLDELEDVTSPYPSVGDNITWVGDVWVSAPKVDPTVLKLGDKMIDFTITKKLLDEWAWDTTADTLNIGYGVVNIGARCFGRNYNSVGGIKRLYLPTTITNLETGAFQSCKALSGNLVIPNSVVSIGSYCFYDCGFDGTLTLSTKLNYIHPYTFAWCNFTGQIAIPSNVQVIDDYAFYKCVGFTGGLAFGLENLRRIGRNAFSDCSGLNGTLSIPPLITKLEKGVFQRCSNLTGNINIPTTITEIDDDVFDGCSSFTGDLNLSDYITNIGERAFQNCSGLTGDLVLGTGLLQVGDGAFTGCSGFDTMYTGSGASVFPQTSIPPNITQIYYKAGTAGWTSPWNGIPTAPWTSYPDPMP